MDSSFLLKFFSCCFPDDTNDQDNLNLSHAEEPKQVQNKKIIEEKPIIENNEVKVKEEKPIIDEVKENNTEKPIFPDKFIREEEQRVITFTKEGIISFIELLKGLQYEEVLKQDSLTLSVRKEGSPVNDKNILVHSSYFFLKSSFNKTPSLSDITKVLFSVEERKKWDDSLQLLELLEEFSEGAMIIHGMSKRQLMVISERESFDKRYSFLDNGVYYSFASAVPDPLYPTSEGVVRIESFLNVYTIKEESDRFIFDVYNQVDLKMNVPLSMMKMIFPKKIKEVNSKVIQVLNQNSN